ncbi:hypothetical protein SDC9_60662 [bioreactor metagenome]|uniref:Antirestriction protein ArdA n=1 Tax=bioreactor metagenome TaxID=1076179 RepID=A0A644XDJ5_9ZZZZ
MKTFEALNRLPSTPQEMMWLRERMETLSVKESLILSAALMGKPACDARDVINIFQTMSDYEVCYPAGSYEALGRFCLRYDAQLPQELGDYIDLEQLGKNYEDEHPGAFIGNCYVEYSYQGPATRYDGTNLAACVDDGWSVKVKLASERCPDGVWLRLPDYEDANDGRPDEMRITLDELDVKGVDECTLLEARCILPEVGDLTEQYDRASDLVYDGQNLGFVLDERGQGMQNFMELYAGALEYEDCRTLAEALDIAESLNRYEIIPDVSLREYAEQELKKQGVALPESVAASFHYEEYAAALLERRGFLLTRDESAYVGKVGQTFSGMTMT